MRPVSAERFFAKLLFQYRVGEPNSSKFRICEERIVSLRSKSAEVALRESKRLGRKSESRYVNSDGENVYIEFVGILDLMGVGIECEPNEVWYEMKTMLRPMERRSAIVPAEKSLLVRAARARGQV